jgi:hypothetical protein
MSNLRRDEINAYLLKYVEDKTALQREINNGLESDRIMVRKAQPKTQPTHDEYKREMLEKLNQNKSVESQIKKLRNASAEGNVQLLQGDEDIRLIDSQQDYQTSVLKNEFMKLLGKYIYSQSDLNDIFNYFSNENPMIIEELVHDWEMYEPKIRKLRGQFVDNKFFLNRLGNMVLANVNLKYPLRKPLVDYGAPNNINRLAVDSENNSINQLRRKNENLEDVYNSPEYNKDARKKVSEMTSAVQMIQDLITDGNIEEPTLLFRNLKEKFTITKANLEDRLGLYLRDGEYNLIMKLNDYVENLYAHGDFERFYNNIPTQSARTTIIDYILEMDIVKSRPKVFYDLAKQYLGGFNTRSKLEKKLDMAPNKNLEMFYLNLLSEDKNIELSRTPISSSEAPTGKDKLETTPSKSSDTRSSISSSDEEPMKGPPRPPPPKTPPSRFSMGDLQSGKDRLKTTPSKPSDSGNSTSNSSMEEQLKSALAERRRLIAGDKKEEDGDPWGEGLRKGEKKVNHKYFIDHNKLDNNILEVRYNRNRHLTNIKSQYVGGAVKKIVKDISIGTLDTTDYHKLSGQEKHLVRQLLHMFDKGDLLKDDDNAFEKEFQVLMGSWNAGNNSELLRKQLKQFILYGIKINKIPRNTGLNMLMELSV